MWPWVSAAFAYLCYSTYAHLRYREAPGGAAVALAAAASIVPDLVDKPLSWQYGVFATGYALGHSIFTSLAVIVLAHLVARRTAHPRWGLAVGLGFLSHNVGDALQDVLAGDPRAGVAHVLWPLVRTHRLVYPGFRGTFTDLLAEYLHHLLHPEFTPAVLLVTAAGVCTFALWAYDGFPVLHELVERWSGASG